jgi:hypothetical protein
MEGAVLGRHHHRLPVEHADHLGITDPVRRQQDYFVLRIEQRVEQVEDGLLGAGADDDVLRRHLAVVALVGVTDDGLLQRRQSVGRGVLDVAVHQFGGGRQHRRDRGLVLRFADPQMDDRLAAFAQIPGLFVECQGRGFADRPGQLAQRHSLPLRPAPKPGVET